MTHGAHGESLAMGQGSHSALVISAESAPARTARNRKARRWGFGFVAVAFAWLISALVLFAPTSADAAVVCTVNKTIARGSSILIDFTGSNSGSACNITIAVSTNTAPTHGTLTREPVGTSGRNRRIIYTHTDTSNSTNSDSFVMDGDNFGDTINVNITIQSADLRTSVSNSGAALQGETGYVINGTVSNQGTSVTSGTVTATYSLPTGVTATAISGTGWTCTLVTTSCTRSDALANGGSYPTVDLTVSFASNATSPKVVSFSASGLEDVSSNNSSSTSITVNSPTPTVTAVSPTAGPTAGGTTVVITGTNFTGVTAVSFGGTPASGFTFNSATQITATAPAHTAGTVDVSVTTPSGTSANTAADDYTYVAAPTVTAVSPDHGPTSGGTSVVITGTNLSGATAVTFGGTAASGYTINSGTQITATAPAGTGTVDVRVTTVGGTSATSAADHYTFIGAPTVTGLSPTTGSSAGGTSVVITGTNFTDVQSVSFGGSSASFTVDGATQITATSPAHAAGVVDVSVTTDSGTNSNTASDDFTYAAIELSPSSLADATVGAGYSQTVSASGGTGPYSYAVTAGSLPAGLLLNNSTGELSGTPTEGGSFNFTVTATDTSDSSTGAQAYSLTVNAPTITVAPNFPPNMTVGQAYSQTFTASGGTATYSYAITAGSLPAGMSLSSAGVLSGTPTQGGTFNFTVTATDSSTGTGPYTGSHAYTLLAQNAIVTTTGTLGDGAVGQAYSQTLGGSGGTAPYSFQITGGALPAGLSLNASTGEASGTPTASGAFSVFIVATDSSTGTGPYFGGQSYSFNIAAPTVVVDTASLPDPQDGEAYSQTVTASGGTAPYAFAVTAGSLPAGLTLASDGTLSGTPSELGTFNFTITATDSTTGDGPYTANQAYSFTVQFPNVAAGPNPTDGTIGVAYSGSISMTGGTQPFSFTQTGGALPAGVSLASDGTLSGTPTEAGTFNFTVDWADSSTGTGPAIGSQSFSLTINAPTLALAPASLTNATVGAAYSGSVSASGGTAPYGYAVTSGALPAGLTLESDGDLTGTPTSAGVFNFDITATDSSTGTGAPFTVTRAYSLTVDAATITVSPATLTDGAVGSAYSGSVTASGGTAPYSFAITAGALPNGMSLASDGTLSGTPTDGGTFNFTVTATDSSGGTGAPFTGSRAYSLTIGAPTIDIDPFDTVDGQIGVAYSDTVTASGGVGPYTYAVTAGSLPAGLSLNASTGEISGTPTEAGLFTPTITATDSSGGAGPYTGSRVYGFQINAPNITIAAPASTSLTIAAAYSDSVSASGGTGPYTYAVTGGALPNGVSLASDGTLSGTPTEAGSFNFTVSATDSSTGTAAPFTGSDSFVLTVGAPTITVAPAGVADGTVGQSYSETVTASGGTGPYTFAVTAGSLPAGLSLASNGDITGTPTAGGTFNFTVTASDSSSGTGAPFTGSRAYSLTINAPTITVAPVSLTAADVGQSYSASISASGGTSGYTFAVTAGSLPAGLTLASDGTLSGTPTAGGTFNFTVTATDSSTGAGPYTGSRAYSLTVNAPTVAVSPASLPNAAIGSAYSQNVSASGATSPYSFAVTGGSLPAGLTLASNGDLTGTPTAAGSFNFTITATDSSTGTGPYTGSRAYTLVVDGPTLSLAPVSLGNGAVASSYSDTVSASGGTAPYSYAVTAGALPPGMSLASNGALSGTPTAGGTFNFTVTATDSSTGTGAPFTTSRAYSLTIDAPTIALAPIDTVDGQIGVAYSDSVSASGGTGPYSYAVTGGSLPAGLSLNGATGAITGTPTEGGSFNVTITATDSSGGTGPYTASRLYSFDIVAPTITVSPASIPDGNTVLPVNETFTASGGTAGYSFAVTAGSLPPGLTLSSGGVLSGTPNAAGDYNFTVTATDSSTGAGPYTGSRAYSMHIEQAIPAISPASLPAAQVGASFSQTLSAVNGNAPYTYAVTAGTLPAGLTLSSGGALSGAPTEAGVFNFTVSATDSSGAPGPYTGTIDYTLNVAAPALLLKPETMQNGTVGVALSRTFSTTGGTAPYTYAVTSGALPAGLSLASDGTLSGTPTAGGTFNFTVTATDSSTGAGAPFSTSRAYSLTIQSAVLTVTPVSLPAGRQTQAYSQTLTVDGGIAPYSFAVTSGALPAGLTLDGSTGTISGTPTEFGSFDFTVTATDSSTGSGPYTGARAYHLVINAPPAPVAAAASATVPYNSAGTDIDLSASVTGVATSLSLGTTHAQHGTVTFNGLVATYTPTPGYFGPDSFSYKATGPGGTSPQATVTITVSTPAAPVASDASASVAYNSSGQAIDLSGNVTGVFTSLSVGTAPSHGTVQIVGTTATYTPTAGYFGADSFTFTATGPGGTSAPATVSVTVASPAAPTVTDASASVAYNSAGQAIDLSGNVSGVFTSLDVASQPAHGTVQIVGTTATYVPTAGYFGADSFTFTATGPGGTSAAATVSLTVATPAAPTVTDASANVAYNSAGQAIDLSGNVSGVFTSLDVASQPAHGTVQIVGTTATYVPTAGYFGADSFTFTATGPGGTSVAATVSVTVTAPAAPDVTDASATVPFNSSGTAIDLSGNVSGVFTGLAVGSQPAHGTVSIVGTTATYTPTAGYTGADSFTFTATGPGGTSSAATVSITVDAPPPPDPVPQPSGQSETVASGGTTTIPVENDGGPATGVEITDQPDHGTVQVIGSPSAKLGETQAATGFSLKYTANAGYVGPDSFDYRLVGPGGPSASVTVNINVTAALPTVQTFNVSAVSGGSVTVNVTDGATGGPFSAVAVASGPSQGAAVVNGQSIVYTAPVGFTGSTSFTYTLTGPGGVSAPGTVNVTVNPVPVAQAKTATTLQGVPVTVNVSAGATGGPITGVQIVSVTAGAGSATGLQTGTGFAITYTPAPNFSGTAVVTFRLTNAFTSSAPQTLTVTVDARPDPSQDPDVKGLVDAQDQTTRRFAETQADNFNRRLERLHGDGSPGSSNDLSFNFGDYNERADQTGDQNPLVRLRQEESPTFGDRQRMANIDLGQGTPSARAGERMKAADDGQGSGLGLWTTGVIDFGQRHKQPGQSGVDFTTQGISFGADMRVSDTLVIGAGGGFGFDKSQIGNDGTRNEAHTWVAAAYGSWKVGDNFYVDGVFGAGEVNFDTRRFTPGSTFVFGDRNGDELFGSLSFAWDYQDGPRRFSPYGRILMAKATLGAYTETGDPIWALSFGEQDVDMLKGTLGFRGSYAHEFSNGTVTPHFRAEYHRQFEGNGSVMVRYADLLGGPTYSIDPLELDRNSLTFGVGADWKFDNSLSFSIDYDGGVSDNQTSNRVTLRFSTRF